MLKSFSFLFTLRNICCGYLIESPLRGDSNKYPLHMFLGILNTILFNFSNNPFYHELKVRSIQIVVITSFVVISNVGIKRVVCISSQKHYSVLTIYTPTRKRLTTRLFFSRENLTPLPVLPLEQLSSPSKT